MGNRKTASIIFTGLLLAYVYIFPRWLDWNQNSRFDLVKAIVEQGTLSIDAYVQNTGDYSIFNGRTYSDKAPGLSLLAVSVYAVSRPLTRWEPVQAMITQLGRSPASAATINRPVDQIPNQEFVFTANLIIATWITIVLPAIGLAVVMFRFLAHFGYSARVRAMTVLAYGLATTAAPYSSAFYGHQLVAVLLFVAFMWLHALRQRPPHGWELFAIGMLLGYTILTEIPAALLVAVLSLYAIWIVRRPTSIAVMMLGGLLPLTILGVYNTWIFGTPFTVAYLHSAVPMWREHFGTGLLSVDYFRPEALWGMTFGFDRGLFFVSPILLTVIPGFILLARRSEHRAEWLVCMAIPLALLLVLSASSEWYGGYASGPRYLVPILPFLVWPLAAALDRVEGMAPMRRQVLSILFAIMVAASILVTWSLTVGGQYYAPEDISFPLVKYSWPHIIEGDVARNVGMLLGLRGAWSLLPLIGIITITFYLVWRATQAHGEIPHV